jgi:general secretion pathway protein I
MGAIRQLLDHFLAGRRNAVRENRCWYDLPRGGRQPGRHRVYVRTGLSLLEVMLALAILGGAVAVIGELTRSAARDAEEARALTTAQLLCEAKMNELVSRLLPAQAVFDVPIESLETLDSPGSWSYSILVEQVGQSGLLSVSVTVAQVAESVPRPVQFTLTRWMVDPLMAGPSIDPTTGLPGGGSGTSGGSAIPGASLGF